MLINCINHNQIQVSKNSNIKINKNYIKLTKTELTKRIFISTFFTTEVSITFY